MSDPKLNSALAINALGQCRNWLARQALVGTCTTSALGLMGSLACTPAAEAAEPPLVEIVRYEELLGGVERPNGNPVGRVLSEMPVAGYTYKNGIYTSVLNRIALRIPRIGSETKVHVRESIALVRADQTPATTHLMFDAGGTKLAANSDDAASAVVVTRLRDDRPKDTESVLARLDGGATKRDELSRDAAFEYRRLDTVLGPGLERIIRNRANGSRFPYVAALLKEARATTFGVTRYVVVGTDSFVEFSQIFPCTDQAEDGCKRAALLAMDDFVGGVRKFLMFPTTNE